MTDIVPILGVLAGAIAVADTIPYVRDTLRGSTRPHRGTWLIWGVLAVVVFLSQLADGGSWSLIMVGAQAVLTGLVFLLAIHRGEGGLSTAELVMIAVAGAGVVGWILADQPIVATACVVAADLIGAAMMVPKTYRDPGSETLVTFALASLGGALAAGAVGALDVSLLIYPIYYCLANGAIALLIHQRRLVKRPLAPNPRVIPPQPARRSVSRHPLMDRSHVRTVVAGRKPARPESLLATSERSATIIRPRSAVTATVPRVIRKRLVNPVARGTSAPPRRAAQPAYEHEQEAEALARFRGSHAEYDATGRLDELRATEYARLDAEDQVYLDYTGGGLYAESQLREHMELLRTQVFGNPHSINPTSLASTALVERARTAVLRYFNASPAEYSVIFTANATGALKLVAEAYPFDPRGRLLLTSDNHNSVNGLREYARAAGAATSYLPSTTPSLRVDEDALSAALRTADHGRHNLFAYPAQSNFSGVQHPLEWIAEAQREGWDVLVDCAAFVPTNRLDLGSWHPDFVPVSFYKLLGYPTGVGCLLVRTSALAKLRRPWFAGGTIVAVSVYGDWHKLAGDVSAFEDGTVNYLTLSAVEQGLAYVEAIGIDTIHTRVTGLTGWLLEELAALRHENGRPVVEIYGPAGTAGRGGTIAFNFLRPDGGWVDERVVDRVAAAHRVSLRTGCFCNPGAAELAFGVPRESLGGGMEDALSTFDDYVEATGLQSGGAVRVSLGLATTFADVYRFMRFASEFRDRTVSDVGLSVRERC